MRRLLLALVFLAVPVLSCAQTPPPPPALEDFGGEEWQTESETVMVYWTASGDSAYVHEDSAGAYFRVRMAPDDGDQPQYFYHCASQSQGTVHHLGTVQARLDSVDTSLQSLVTAGDLTAYPSIQEELTCFQSYWTSLDTLLSTVDTVQFEVPESVTYATDCVKDPDNSTFHVPDPSSVGVEPEDTLGVITKRGDCAGYGVVEPWGITMVAATMHEEFVPTGVGKEEPVALLHYDHSEQTTAAYRPTYEDCAEVSGMPVCEDGPFVTESFYQVVGMASIYPE